MEETKFEYFSSETTEGLCAVKSGTCLKMRGAREDDGETQAACAALCRGYCLHTIRYRSIRYVTVTKAVCSNLSKFQFELQNHPAVMRGMLLSALQKWEQLCL
jgi:hypothetical protein